MQVRVLFFGMLKDIVGRSSESLELANESVLADLVNHYQSHFPKLQQMSASIAMAVNSKYADPQHKLKAGDEVGLLPPVSGGVPRASLIKTKISTGHVLSKIKRSEDGATVTFEGIVRDNTRGRKPSTSTTKPTKTWP